MIRMAVINRGRTELDIRAGSTSGTNVGALVILAFYCHVGRHFRGIAMILCCCC